MGIFRSVLGLPFKAYAVVCAPVAIFCPPVATVAMSSWMIGAGIVVMALMIETHRIGEHDRD